MNRQRGFGALELGIVLGILVAAGALFAGVVSYLNHIEQRGFKAGAASVQAKWDAANAQAEKERVARSVAVGKALLAAENAKLAADEKAAKADQRWKEAVRDADRKGEKLIECDQPATGAAAPAGTGVVDRGNAALHGGARFTAEFVRQYDGAWTGLDGEPVFDTAARPDAAAGAGIAWVVAEDVRDVQGENARRCSQDRRNYASLITKIRDAAAAWDKANHGASP